MKINRSLIYIMILTCVLLAGCSKKEQNTQESSKTEDAQATNLTENETGQQALKQYEDAQNLEEVNEAAGNNQDTSNNEKASEEKTEANTEDTEIASEEPVNNSSKQEVQTAEGERVDMETKILVYKADRTLELWQNGQLTQAYHIGLGKNAEGRKEIEGDKKTPEGEYYVCTKNQYSKFYLSLGVSYPNIEDAVYGLENGIIDESTYQSIETAIQNGQCPPWNTALGGEIMIHGHGGSEDWTKGCIAVDDEVMNVLWEACSIGTKIIIYP
jgi:murein L,D-transpeptidase YafK